MTNSIDPAPVPRDIETGDKLPSQSTVKREI